MSGIPSGILGVLYAHSIVDLATKEIVQVADLIEGSNPSVENITGASPLGKEILKATSPSEVISTIGAATSSQAFKTEQDSKNETEGHIASKSTAAQSLFAFPQGTTSADMYNSEKRLRVAEIGSVPEDTSGREVVYIKGTASPGSSQFEHDFVIKVYLNPDGTTSVGIGETGAELHENGNVTGSVWGEGGLKAYIDSKLP